MKLKIVVNSEAQAPFWIRVFKLESEIEEVRQLMQNDPTGRRKFAAVPVINQFHVDAELEFVYCLIFNVDAVGANHVIGAVLLCDQANREQVVKVRDEMADDVMRAMSERHDQEVKEGKGEYVDMIKIIDTGKETADTIMDDILKGRKR